MDTSKQTISVDLNGSFVDQALTVLREWTKDEPTSERCLILGDMASGVCQEMWTAISSTMNRIGVPNECQSRVWNSIVLESWNTVSEGLFGGRFQAVAASPTQDAISTRPQGPKESDEDVIHRVGVDWSDTI